jgi:hypothetical protein
VYALLEKGTQPSLSEDVDFPVKQFFQVLAELDKVEKATPTIHVYKEVNIAFRLRFSPHCGPKNPHIPGSMMGSKLENTVAAGSEQISGCHVPLFTSGFM